jgi:hypothetical protein
MKKIIFFFTLGFLNIKGNAQLINQCNSSDWVKNPITAAPVNNPAYKPGWHLVFNEDFDGGSINTNDWTLGYGVNDRIGTTNQFRGFFLPSNVSLVGGMCYVSTNKTTYPNQQFIDPNNSNYFANVNYTGGCIQTKEEYGIGTFSEAKLTRIGPGFKSSYWSYDYHAGTTVGEGISVLDNEFNPGDERKLFSESFRNNSSNVLESCAAYYNVDNSLPAVNAVDYTYSSDWQTDATKVYVNNQLGFKCQSHIPQSSSNQKWNFWTSSIYWNSNIEGNSQGFDKMTIDYFRVYKQNYGSHADITEFCQTKGYTNQNLNPRFMADINADGKKDIVAFGQNCLEISLSNIASKDVSFLAKQNSLADYTPGQGWTLLDERPRMMGDITGDKKEDIVAFGYGGVFTSASTSNGNSISFAPQNKLYSHFSKEDGWLDQTHYPRFLADVNGDGLMDIVGIGTEGGFSGVHVSFADPNAGNSNSPPFAAPIKCLQNQFVGSAWPDQNVTPRAMADINGDGRADIVGFGNGGVWVAFSNVGSFNMPVKLLSDFSTAQGWTDQNTRPRLLGDINGDGRADVVGFGMGVYASLSLSSHNTNYLTNVAWVSGNFNLEQGFLNLKSHPRYLYDINNDKKADIIGFNNDIIQIAISKSWPTTAGFDQYNNFIDEFTPSKGWVNEDNSPRLFSDINGDGSVDLIGFGYSCAFVSQDIGGLYNVPFTVISSTKNTADNWYNNASNDAAYRFYLPYKMDLTISTNYPESTPWHKVEIFNDNGTSTGLISTSSNNDITGQLVKGYYYIVIDNNGWNPNYGPNYGNFKLTVSGSPALRLLSEASGLSKKSPDVETFMLFPNPAQNEIFITTEKEDEELDIKIYDVNSKLLIDQKILAVNSVASLKLDLNNGIYFISLNSEHMQKIVKKLVIAK